jgi:putative transposase
VAGGQSLPRRERAAADTGPGSRAARVAMAYKLIDVAQARRRAVNAPHLVALVRARRASKGKLLQRPTRSRAKPSTANHQTVGSEVAETHQSTSLDDSSVFVIFVTAFSHI